MCDIPINTMTLSSNAFQDYNRGEGKRREEGGERENESS